MAEAKHTGGPVDRLDLLGAIIDDERARMIHAKVARHILTRYYQKFDNARASARFLQVATGLTAGSVVQATSDLVEWGYFTRTIGSGKRPSEYSPNFGVLQPQNTSSVPPLPNTTETSVLQPPNATVLQSPNAKGVSVLQPQNQTLLLNPATARVTVKDTSATGVAAGLSAAAARAPVRLKVTHADIVITDRKTELSWEAVDGDGQNHEDAFYLEHFDMGKQDYGQKRFTELLRAAGIFEAPEDSESLIGIEFDMSGDDYVPADPSGRRAMGIAA